MKSKKIVIYFLFVFILAILLFLSVFFILRNSSKKEIQTSSSAYLGILEDGTYYIPKAKNNITFEIDSINTAYQIKDEDGQIQDTSIMKDNDKYYIKSKNKYQEGSVYTIELTNGNFTNKALKDAKKIKFKIEEQKKANYKLGENVSHVDTNKIEVLESNSIKLDSNNYSVGDIIVVQDSKSNKYNAFKIDTIHGDIATTSIPEVNEIYQDFELYEDRKIDFTNIKINEEFKDNIKLAVKKSPLYKFLVNEVYAADDVKTEIKVTPSTDNLTIDVSIIAKAKGAPFLGIKALSDHDLVIKFKIILGAQFIADIEKGKEFNLDMAMTQTVEANISLSTNNEILKGIENIPDSEYIKSIQDITDRLENATEDSTEGHLKVAGLEVPTQIPFANVFFDVYLQNAFSINLNMSYNQTITLEEHVGIIMNKNESTTYFNYSEPQTTQDMEVVGKAEFRVGAGVDIGLSLVNKDIAHVSIGEEMGLYAELFITAKMNIINLRDAQANFEGRAEAGLYLKCKVEAGIDVLFLKKELKKDIVDLKKPFIKFEKKLEYQTEPTQEAPPQEVQNKVQSTYNGTMQGISINSDSDAVRAYKQYIKDKKFANDFTAGFSGVSTLKNVGYSIFDIDQNGIPELIIEASEEFDTGWRYNIFYTYVNNAVYKIQDIYNYGGVRYNQSTKEIMYTDVRGNVYSGGYGFYILSNNQFELVKTVGHDGGYTDETGRQVPMSYFVTRSGEDTEYISQEEQGKYFDNLEYFSYSDITKVN